MKNINFEDEGFQPLKNISLLGQRIAGKGVDRVIYFTDSRSFPEPVTDADVGTLLGWRLEDVGVTIVTSSSCDQWNYKNLVTCQTLSEYPDLPEVKAILEQWRQ
jgi:hypothetical protein